MAERYDLIIIGAGPAGLTAGLYACRARLKCLLLEKELIGGQIVNAELIENYPGFTEGIAGSDLAPRIVDQALNHGLELQLAEAIEIALVDGDKVVKTADGVFQAGALIVAGGSEAKKLGVPGEERLHGRGVSYCATCDGPLFKEQEIAVVGGGDAALDEALTLAEFASRVTVIHRRDQLRATRILQERALNNPKISFIWNAIVEEIEGDERVGQLRLYDKEAGNRSALSVSGIFVAIGRRPLTDYLRDVVPLDEGGHIITNELMETAVPGILAAGDVRHNSARQAITAAGDGATASLAAQRFLGERS